MPRSRRRHHSRSRSRSRSHSHDRDREPKRRKVDSIESPNQKRSVSSDDPTTAVADATVAVTETTAQIAQQNDEPVEVSSDSEDNERSVVEEVAGVASLSPNSSVSGVSTAESELLSSTELVADKLVQKAVVLVEDVAKITPKKTMSPKLMQKILESEKKRQQKQQEQEEKKREREEKKRQKQELEEQKQKERAEMKEKKAKEKELLEEQKRKEKEEKEQKRKEREEREEQKRKEREQEKLRKQQEIDEKNKEKQRQEEKKQKAAAAFVNFFTPKKVSGETATPEEKKTEIASMKFMPFEVKSDMKLPPKRRPDLTDEERSVVTNCVEFPDENASYLKDLKNGKPIRKCPKTWPYEDSSEDCVIVEEDFGESICEDKPKLMRMRSKFLKFRENRRPPYCGTWRKKSKLVNPRKPFAEDRSFFDYEVDSDDDWEEEEQGESLNGSDDEEKENEADNEDYEVDNEFFVPHGHLSDDEVDDEATSKLSPESHKQKLKLLKDEFDQDMKAKTHKIKPRSIGCVWYNKDGSNVEEAIDRHLRPLAMLTNGVVLLKKRSELIICTPNRKHFKELKRELIPQFLKLIHLNVNKRKTIVEDFLVYLQNNGIACDISKANLGRNLREFAQWKKCPEEGPMFNKFCWYINDDVKEKFNVDLPVPK